MNIEEFNKRVHQVSTKYESIYSSIESVFRTFYELPLLEGSKIKNPLEVYGQLKFVAEGIRNDVVSGEFGSDRAIILNKYDMMQHVNLHLEQAREYVVNGERLILTRPQYIEICTRTLITLLYPLNHNTDMIVDLAGGWGHRLFDLYLGGIRSEKYVLLERSAAARQCSDLVYSLFNDLFEFSCYHFDWNNLEDMPVFENQRNVILFSACGIESVPKFVYETFDVLIEKFPHVENLCGVHLESITFQIPTEKYNNPLRYGRDKQNAVNRKENMDFYKKLSRTKKVCIQHVNPGIFELDWDGRSMSTLIWKLGK